MHKIFASFLLLAACSSDPLEPGAGDSAGTGTNTLSVEGQASAEPRFPNASAATDFDTDFSVRIELNGNLVSSGTVTIKSRFEEVTLTWQDPRWEGTMAGYDEVYRLDIISGADKVTDVIVDGPDIHSFSKPTAGATLDSTMPNLVAWDREDHADITSFEADQIGRITIEDTGTFTMGAGSMQADRDQARENTLEIRRTNHVIPAGAAGGSDFAVTVMNEIDVLAAPNPAL